MIFSPTVAVVFAVLDWWDDVYRWRRFRERVPPRDRYREALIRIARRECGLTGGPSGAGHCDDWLGPDGPEPCAACLAWAALREGE